MYSPGFMSGFSSLAASSVYLHGRMREGAVVLDNLPAAVGLVLAGPAVDLGTHRNLDAVLGLVLLLGGERYGVLNRLEHLLLGQALLV